MGLVRWIYFRFWANLHPHTQQPLFALRRVLDNYEASNKNCYITLLDWEKAFDKVNQERLIAAMYRFGIPEKMCEVIKSIYANPQFQVVDEQSTSTARKQHAGIRQGCPLSLFLFIILLTVMLEDIDKDSPQIEKARAHRTTFNELLFADDTLLITKDKDTMEHLLHKIEEHSEYYNLRLNLGKCVSLEIPGVEHIRFADGTQMKKEQNTKYLGSIINAQARRQEEINQRIKDTYTVF